MSQKGCQEQNRTMETLSQCDTQSLYIQKPGPIISLFLDLNIIVHLFVSSLDAHFAVPIVFNHQSFSSYQLSDIKKKTISYIEKSLPYLAIDLQQPQNHFFSVDQNSILYFHEDLSVQHLLKEGNNLLRLQEKISYFGRPSTKRKDRKGKLLVALQTQRKAYLLPRHHIMTRGRLSILNTFAQKLTTQMILMTNEVNCLSDKQISEPINQIHQHNNVYGALVRLQYSKDNQYRIIELYQQNIVLYSKQNPPFVYQQATAGQIAAEFDSGQQIFIFDSHNNYCKVTKAEKAEPKLHIFYSLSTKSNDSQQMLVVDDVRVLNSVDLVEPSQIVVLKQNGKKLNVDILYVFKEELNYQHYHKYGIEIHQYVQKLDYKSQEGLDIYLNHNIPNIQVNENQFTRKDFYRRQFWLTVQPDKIMSLKCNKIQKQCVLYFQQGVKATESPFSSNGKNILNFKAKVNHYLPSNSSQSDIILPNQSYFLVNKHQSSSHLFEIIELEAPQANAETYILWVDDHPNDTISLASQIKASSLEAKINIINVLGLKHAVSWLKTFYLYIRWKWPNRLIKMITDMQLNGQQQAGTNLIKEIHLLGVNIPILFFVSKNNALEILQRRNFISQDIGITAEWIDLLNWCLS